MKRYRIILFIAMISIIISSCGSSKKCPAYSSIKLKENIS